MMPEDVEYAKKLQEAKLKRLPVKIHDGTKAEMEAWGIRFPENTEKDPLYQSVVLPLGWEHGRWRQDMERGPWVYHLLDEKNYIRGMVTLWFNLSGGDAWISLCRSPPDSTLGSTLDAVHQ